MIPSDAQLPFKIVRDHRLWHQSKARIQFFDEVVHEVHKKEKKKKVGLRNKQMNINTSIIFIFMFVVNSVPYSL